MSYKSCLKKSALSFYALLLLTGCSTIIEGRSQEIVVNTNPSGANCSLIRNSIPIGNVSPTPSAVLIEKTKYDIIIKCNKEGYQEATYFNKSGSAGATFGNIAAGGLIGWGIDSATGSDNKYDSPVNISMVPVEYVIANEAIIEKTKTTKAKSLKKKTETQHIAPTTTADTVTPVVAESVPPKDINETIKPSSAASDYPTGKR